MNDFPVGTRVRTKLRPQRGTVIHSEAQLVEVTWDGGTRQLVPVAKLLHVGLLRIADCGHYEYADGGCSELVCSNWAE